MKLLTRQRLTLSLTVSAALLLTILVLSITLSDDNLLTKATQKNQAPALEHLFGTDWLGRDMLTRTMKGLRFSMLVGLAGASLGVVLAVVLGVMAGTLGKRVDTAVLWLTDMFISMPHLVFLVLISIAVGGGAKGVIVGTALTHWPALARLVRNEVHDLARSEYILVSENLGKSRMYIVRNHLLPALFPQLMVGFLLLFPHVILHEAAMTFLGFGLSAQSSSIGIILSEAVRHIVLGNWWLVVFPGLMLLLVVKSFDSIGQSVRRLLDPQSSHT